LGKCLERLKKAGCNLSDSSTSELPYRCLQPTVYPHFYINPSLEMVRIIYLNLPSTTQTLCASRGAHAQLIKDIVKQIKIRSFIN